MPCVLLACLDFEQTVERSMKRYTCIVRESAWLDILDVPSALLWKVMMKFTPSSSFWYYF